MKPTKMSGIATAWKEVNDLVITTALARNSAKMPCLVAVSKFKPANLVQECYDAGQRHFGENYVQELVEKASILPKDIKWHFIGHLQTNKAKILTKVPNLEMIQTVDSFKLANSLNKAINLEERDKLKILVQVNTGNEETKSGIETDEILELVKKVIHECPNLQFRGLMTIGRPDVLEDMDTLCNCKNKLYSDYPELEQYITFDDFELSMGMSSDFVQAIEKGSTIVRVGSSIFGSR